MYNFFFYLSGFCVKYCNLFHRFWKYLDYFFLHLLSSLYSAFICLVITKKILIFLRFIFQSFLSMFCWQRQSKFFSSFIGFTTSETRMPKRHLVWFGLAPKTFVCAGRSSFQRMIFYTRVSIPDLSF